MSKTPTNLKFINGTFCTDCYAAIATFGGVLITVRPLVDGNSDNIEIGYRARVVPLNKHPEFHKDSKVVPMNLDGNAMLKMFPSDMFIKASDTRLSFFRISKIEIPDDQKKAMDGINTLVSTEFVQAMANSVFQTFKQVSGEVHMIADFKEVSEYFRAQYGEFVGGYKQDYLQVSQENVTAIGDAKKK